MTVLPNGSSAVTVNLNAVFGITVVGPMTAKCVAAAGVTDTDALTLRAVTTVSKAVRVWTPGLTRVAPEVKTWTPPSAGTNV